MYLTTRELLQLKSPRDTEHNQTETSKDYYAHLEDGDDYLRVIKFEKGLAVRQKRRGNENEQAEIK
jgi:hypothetical protein